MKYKVKFIIYLIILFLFAAVVWIKYDYDKGDVISNGGNVTNLSEFMYDNNITSSTFSCPAKNNTIIFLNDYYLLTSTGELYDVKYDSLFDNGHNCKKIETDINITGFYNESIVYDEEYNFYDLKNNLNIYVNDLTTYYKDNLTNLELINSTYPYIYFYDVESKTLELDNTNSSNKLMVDNKGNISFYTNYGYPMAESIINDDSIEIIFNRKMYGGKILTLYRSHNNELLDSSKVKYLSDSIEKMDKVYGIRLITSKGLYNEVISDKCDSDCSTKLELDIEFSNYFNNIVYSNGKYLFTKENPTTIYNISKYTGAK